MLLAQDLYYHPHRMDSTKNSLHNKVIYDALNQAEWILGHNLLLLDDCVTVQQLSIQPDP